MYDNDVLKNKIILKIGLFDREVTVHRRNWNFKNK